MSFDFGSAFGGAGAGASAGGPWGALAGGVIGGIMGGNQQSASAKAAEDQLNFEKQMYQQQDPFSAGGNRAQYVDKVNQYAQGGPTSVANDPMYQAMSAKSNEDMGRGMAASGAQGSGQEALALRQNDQGNMMNYWSTMLGTYSGLSGATGGRTAPMQGISPALAGQNAGQTAQNYGSAFGMFAGGLSSIFGSSNGDGSGGSSGGGSGGGSGSGVA